MIIIIIIFNAIDTAVYNYIPSVGLCFSQKVRGCVPTGKDHLSTISHPAPVYEIVVLNRQQEQNVELKENHCGLHEVITKTLKL